MNRAQTVSGKSPYRRTHFARRAQGKFLLMTVVVLLLVVGAWIMATTRAIETTPLGGSQLIDPGAAAQSGGQPEGVGASTRH